MNSLPVPDASPDHPRWMNLAMREAERAADVGEVPVGAVVVYQDAVIGSAHNEVESRGDATAHAEMLALREAAGAVGGWRLIDADLYVTLEPCPMCAGALILSRVRSVVFGARDPKFGGCGSVTDLFAAEARWNHRVETVEGVCAEQSAELLRGFFRSRRAQDER